MDNETTHRIVVARQDGVALGTIDPLSFCSLIDLQAQVQYIQRNGLDLVVKIPVGERARTAMLEAAAHLREIAPDLSGELEVCAAVLARLDAFEEATPAWYKKQVALAEQEASEKYSRLLELARDAAQSVEESTPEIEALSRLLGL